MSPARMRIRERAKDAGGGDDMEQLRRSRKEICMESRNGEIDDGGKCTKLDGVGKHNLSEEAGCIG